MCELMGYSFAKPIVADFTIREFARRGEENADGWDWPGIQTDPWR